MEEAMQLVNSHEYGNGSCIFTRDGEAARYFASGESLGGIMSAILSGIEPRIVAGAPISGGGGLTSDFGLAYSYARARVIRLADGPDEVHRDQIARLELRKYR